MTLSGSNTERVLASDASINVRIVDRRTLLHTKKI